MNDPFSQDFWRENNDLDGALEGALDHPPICPSCGVTMLPADAFSEAFSCQNDDCEADPN